MEPSLAELQGKVRSYVNWAIVGSIRRLGCSVDALPAEVVVVLCGASVFVLYAYMYNMLPWVLWRHMVVDTLAFLLLPFLLATYTKTIGNMGSFLRYEDLKANYGFHDYAWGVDLHPWVACKYYQYVTHTNPRFVSVAYDVQSSKGDHESVAGEETDRHKDDKEEAVESKAQEAGVKPKASKA